MEEYALYLLTGAIFGSLVAVVYQLKLLLRMEKRTLSLEQKIENILEERKGKANK